MHWGFSILHPRVPLITHTWACYTSCILLFFMLLVHGHVQLLHPCVCYLDTICFLKSTQVFTFGETTHGCVSYTTWLCKHLFKTNVLLHSTSFFMKKVHEHVDHPTLPCITIYKSCFTIFFF